MTELLMNLRRMTEGNIGQKRRKQSDAGNRTINMRRKVLEREQLLPRVVQVQKTILELKELACETEGIEVMKETENQMIDVQLQKTVNDQGRGKLMLTCSKVRIVRGMKEAVMKKDILEMKKCLQTTQNLKAREEKVI